MDVKTNATLDLDGKTVVITGASRGIGAETARRMAAAGARVVVNYHGSEAAANAVVSEIGERAIAIRADVADPAAVKRLIEAVVTRLGSIDVLVNNAAIFE
ncbi:MAG TPA: SDR family NAD(P)-dependent oxidoreductase, partial [Thermoanaerobaculia bacterium]